MRRISVANNKEISWKKKDCWKPPLLACVPSVLREIKKHFSNCKLTFQEKKLRQNKQDYLTKLLKHCKWNNNPRNVDALLPVWRCRDLPFSNREPQFSISGFQHEQICTSNHCTHLISHCACPVIHCRISKQNLRPRHTKLSLIIRQPMGKLYQTPLLPAEKDQVTRNRSIGRPNSFPHAARNHAFDPQKGSCKRLSRRQPHQSRLQLSPPIRFLSPAPTIIQPSHCCFVYTGISPLWKAVRAWASYKYAF